jgi:hypothetical protein
MIRVFQIRTMSEGSSVTCQEPELFFRYGESIRAGVPLLPQWQPLHCQFNDGEGEYPQFDFCTTALGFGTLSMTYLGQKKRAALTDMLRKVGELLPIVFPEDDEATIFNVTRIVDCLDQERTEYSPQFLRESIRMPRNPVFRASKLRGVTFFRIPELFPVIYIAEPEAGGFKALYDQLRLMGLEFIEMAVTQDGEGLE